MRESLWALTLFYAIAACGAEPDPKLVRVVDTLRAAVNTDDDMRVMREVWARDRWFTFPKFRETSEYLVAEMKRRGVTEARVLAAPADGKTQYGYWTMPLAWDVRSARLALADGTVLADYEKVPASLGMWSGPTPAGGVEAEIVYGKDADWRGKLVLTDANPAGLKSELVRRGALGAINGFSENRALRHERQWVNAWGDKGWGFLKGDTPLVCFSITPAQVEDLKSRLAKSPVRARAVVDARLYEGEYSYMTALLPGTSSEEVLTLGHIAEQGAHDNATGVAAMAGALGTLRRLIAEGKLAPPRRGIRMLAMGELYGTMHWLSTTPRKPVAAITLDTPAGPYEMPGTTYDFYMNPQVAASYTDALVLAVADAHLSRLSPPRAFAAKAFMPGTDSFLGEPMIGIDTVWPYSGTGVHSHHNSADRPETVDARSLRDLTVITAAYLYAIASAGDAELPWLAGLTAARYEGLLAQAATVDWVKAPDLGAALHEAREQIRYREERGLAAVASVRKLGRADLAAANERVRKAAAAALDAVQANANLASRMMGRGPEVTAVAPAAEPAMVEAAKIVVRRKRMGSITLDDLPQSQWEGWPSGAWGTREQLALFWCDGKRTLADVIRLTKLEAGAAKFDFVGYFRFLEKHGYVEFAK